MFDDVGGDGLTRAQAREEAARGRQRKKVHGYLLVPGGATGRTVYRERTPKLWTFLVLTVYALGVAAMSAGAPPEDLGVIVFLSVLFFVVFVVWLLIPPFQKFRHNRILLTDRVLKIGKHVVPLERLALETAAPDRGPQTLDRIGLRVSLNHRVNTPMGYTPVVLYTRHGDLVAVDSRRPEELVRALHGLGPAGAPGGHGPMGWGHAPQGHLRHPGGA